MLDSKIRYLNNKQALTPFQTSITLAVNNNITVTASGGSPNYLYTSVSGAIDSNTGLYIAPTQSGTDTITITDSVGSSVQIVVTINPALELNSSNVVLGKQSQHTYNFSASGGVPPYTYTLQGTNGTVDPTLGVYSVGTAIGDETLVVTDSFGNTISAIIKIIDFLTNDTVYSTLLNPNASGGTDLYIGGNFTSIYPYYAPKISKLDLSSGNIDAGFSGEGFDGIVRAIVESPDKKYFFVGGSFTTYQGQPAYNIAKIDKKGRLDTTFTQSSGFSHIVFALAIKDNSLFVGGGFTTYRGLAAPRIAKLDAMSGELDATFNLMTGFNSTVYTLALHGSSLYVGGNFITYRGFSANKLAKLDSTNGELDRTFTTGSGFNSTVYSLAASGDYLFLGGMFTSYRTSATQRIAKIELSSGNGNLDTTFSTLSGANNTVFAIAVSESNLYIGGTFTSYKSQSLFRLAKIDIATGDIDTTFTLLGDGMYGSTVNALAIFGNSLYVGGDFNLYRNSKIQRVAKLDLVDGTLDTTFSQKTGFSNTVYSLISDNSSLYVGGGFSSYRGQSAERLAKFDLASKLLDTTFTTDTGLDSYVKSMVIQGSSLYIGGAFNSYRGLTASKLAKIDLINGDLDTNFTTINGFDNNINSIISDGSSLYVGGAFITYRSQNAQRLAKVDLINGNLDTVFALNTSGLDNFVNALAIFEDSLYVGGGFNLPTDYLAKFNLNTGVLDAGFGSGNRFSYDINTLAANGSSLYVGGGFGMYGTQVAYRIAKIDAKSGVLDSTFTDSIGFDNEVNVITISGSSLYVGGYFATYRSQNAQRLAKVDLISGALDTTFTKSTGFNNSVHSLSTNNSLLYVGGMFTSYNGKARNYFTSVNLISGD